MLVQIWGERNLHTVGGNVSASTVEISVAVPQKAKNRTAVILLCQS
jgi:hypothetical protein